MLQSKEKLYLMIEYCDCPFCKEIILMIKEREEMLLDE